MAVAAAARLADVRRQRQALHLGEVGDGPADDVGIKGLLVLRQRDGAHRLRTGARPGALDAAMAG